MSAALAPANPAAAPAELSALRDPGRPTAADWIPAFLLVSASFALSHGAPGGGAPAAALLLTAGSLAGLFYRGAHRGWFAAILLAWGFWYNVARPSFSPAVVAEFEISIPAACLLLFLLASAGGVLLGRHSRLAAGVQAALTALIFLCALPGLGSSADFPVSTVLGWVHGVGFVFAVEAFRRCLNGDRLRIALCGAGLATALVLGAKWGYS